MAQWFALVLVLYGVPVLVYLLFAVPALAVLRHRDLDDTTRAVWALAIVAVPVMGAVAFAFVGTGSRAR